MCVCVCVVHHVQCARFIDLMLQCTYYPSSSQRQLIPWRCGAILHTQNDTDTHTHRQTGTHTQTYIYVCSVAVCTLHAHTRIWALGCARKVGQVCAAGGSLAKPSGIGKCARVMLPTLGAPQVGRNKPTWQVRACTEEYCKPLNNPIIHSFYKYLY